jgi:hypothetical protein
MPAIIITGPRAIFEPDRVIEALRHHLGVGRAEAQSLADAIHTGRTLRLPVDSDDAARAFSVALRDAGADATIAE